MCKVFKLNNENNRISNLVSDITLFKQYHLTNNIISTILRDKPALLRLPYTKKHPHEYL